MRSKLKGTKTLRNLKPFLSGMYHQRSWHDYQEWSLVRTEKVIKKDNFGTIEKKNLKIFENFVSTNSANIQLIQEPH